MRKKNKTTRYFNVLWTRANSKVRLILSYEYPNSMQGFNYCYRIICPCGKPIHVLPAQSNDLPSPIVREMRHLENCVHFKRDLADSTMQSMIIELERDIRKRRK